MGAALGDHVRAPAGAGGKPQLVAAAAGPAALKPVAPGPLSPLQSRAAGSAGEGRVFAEGDLSLQPAEGY